MYQGYRTNSRHISWLYLFLGGFLFGIFVLNIWRDSFFREMELLNVASLSRLRYMQVDGSTFYVCSAGTTGNSCVALSVGDYLYRDCGTFGLYFVYGNLSGNCIVGSFYPIWNQGILLILVSVLPQYLLLVPAYIMLIGWCWRLCNALYHPGRHCEGGYGTPKQILFRKVVQLLVIVGIIFVGSIVESYINPILLSGFLKIF